MARPTIHKTKEAQKAAHTAARKRWEAKNPYGKVARDKQRRKAGLPEPTRPEPSTCECCNRPPNGQGSLHLDHDHLIHTFRGWLCMKCNLAIGLLGDDIAGVQRALAYLARSYV